MDNQDSADIRDLVVLVHQVSLDLVQVLVSQVLVLHLGSQAFHLLLQVLLALAVTPAHKVHLVSLDSVLHLDSPVILV